MTFQRLSKDDKYLKRKAESKQQQEQQQTATPDITTSKVTQNTRGAYANYVNLLFAQLQLVPFLFVN